MVVVLLIDSHCHLDMIGGDTAAVIGRAKEQGIGLILTVCVDLAEADKIVALSCFDEVYASVGQHPCSAVGGHDRIVERILSVINGNKKVIAIGETGLDFYEAHDNNPPAAMQIESLEAHMEAARISGLPLILHSRNSNEIVDVIGRHKGVKFVMHCFSGDIEFAKKCLDLGGYISFSGILTFKNATVLRDVCSFVPMDRILVETDAPYLAPVPYRGQKNEPAHVRLVAEAVANIRGVGLGEASSAMMKNFIDLFGVGPARHC